jgi:hypothetical protein
LIRNNGFGMITSKMAWLNWIRKLIDGFYSPSRKKIAPPLVIDSTKGFCVSVCFFFLFFFVLPKEGWFWGME